MGRGAEGTSPGSSRRLSATSRRPNTLPTRRREGRRDTEPVTAATHPLAPPRSGPAIHALLAACAPEEVPPFEREFHHALSEAARSFDIAPLDHLLERWRRVAAVRANPLTPHEEKQLRRARAGDDTGLWEQGKDGTFYRID